MAVWDCHVHVFGDLARFPLATERRYTPGKAGLDALRTHLRATGATQAVLVQPTVYGDDHACLFHALDAFGDMAVAVGAWSATAPPPEHPRLRGLRVDLRGDWSDAHAEALRRAAGAAGERHLELQLSPSGLGALAREALTTPVVLDHLAGFPGEDAWPVLDDLVCGSDVFVKLSGLERAPGGLAGALPLARHLARRFPDRLLWGSDWPHTPLHPAPGLSDIPLPFRPVDLRAMLVTLADALGPHLADARSVVPARLYGQPLNTDEGQCIR